MNAALRSDSLIGQILALDVERRQRLEASVIDRLRQSGHRALAQVSVEVNAELVILRGTVSSYYLKQLAQEQVRSITENYDIDNRIAVVAER
jgi:osmotically-inducible protein OsmY